MLAVDEILCSSVMNVNGVKCSLSSYLVIEVENNHKLSVVAVGVVPRFSLKRGLLQSFILILLFSVKTWMRFFFFFFFLFLLPFLFLENTFGNDSVEHLNRLLTDVYM